MRATDASAFSIWSIESIGWHLAAIDRMPAIGGPSIESDLVIEATDLGVSLAAIVTKLAQRLQRTEPKLEFVTMMRLDVVDDFGSDDHVAGKAFSTEWLNPKLMASNLSPALCGVPVIPMRMDFAHGSIAASAKMARGIAARRSGLDDELETFNRAVVRLVIPQSFADFGDEATRIARKSAAAAAALSHLGHLLSDFGHAANRGNAAQ
jgi:hypothetical protein